MQVRIDGNLQSPKPSNANGSSPSGRLILCSLRKIVAIEKEQTSVEQEKKSSYSYCLRPDLNFAHSVVVMVEVYGRIQVRRDHLHHLT